MKSRRGDCRGSHGRRKWDSMWCCWFCLCCMNKLHANGISIDIEFKYAWAFQLAAANSKAVQRTAETSDSPPIVLSAKKKLYYFFCWLRGRKVALKPGEVLTVVIPFAELRNSFTRFELCRTLWKRLPEHRPRKSLGKVSVRISHSSDRALFLENSIVNFLLFRFRHWACLPDLILNL